MDSGRSSANSRWPTRRWKAPTPGLAAAHTRLQAYSAQVEELSAIRERNRIAREIHDTLGHALTLLAVQLETATQLEARGDPRLHEELLEARQVAKACLTEVRHSVEALRPDDASAGSLPEQLRRLVAEFATTVPRTRITLDLEEATHPLSPDLCLTLYRCAQEALTNIRKHAHATKVLLRLCTTDGPEGQVELTVLDNGQGCHPAPRAASAWLRPAGHARARRAAGWDAAGWTPTRTRLARRSGAPARTTEASRGQRHARWRNEGGESQP